MRSGIILFFYICPTHERLQNGEKVFMEKKRNITLVERQKEDAFDVMNNDPLKITDIKQIKRLVHLIDETDISEIELNRVSEGIHLVLRKLKAPAHSTQMNEVQYTDRSKATTPTENLNNSTGKTNLHHLRAQLVGIFHSSLKPRGQVLPAVGDLIKVGQVVGTIEALTIFNEVEATVAGRVIEISVEDGQPVEFGQLLLTIESADGEMI